MRFRAQRSAGEVDSRRRGCHCGSTLRDGRGWWADERQASVAYLIEENRILRARLRGRIRLTDEERRRLAVYGHRVGRRRLCQVATMSHPIRFFGGTDT
jgi:hypothetical protein